jgi:hypothetical protein
MRSPTIKLLNALAANVTLSLLTSCGSPVGTGDSEIDALARSSRGCSAARLQIGLNKDNVVTSDLGSRLSVRAFPDASAQIVGYLFHQNSVSVKSINTGSAEYVEIYPASGLKCATAGCEKAALFVSHRYLEPVNYTPSCKPMGSSSEDATNVLPSNPIISPAYANNYHEKLKSYSNGQPVKSMIRYADANRESGSTGLCLRYVKKAMLNGGRFFPAYPGEVAARKFGPQMENVEFENILEMADYRTKIQSSMKNIPVGCIAIYSYMNINADKNAKYGHIEIRTADGFESDYISSMPRTGSWTSTAGRNRKLIGVYCKVK